MTKPIRIQRKRSAGFNLQTESKARNGLDCVYVGRPTKFGNPLKIGERVILLGMEFIADAELCIELYEDWIITELCKNKDFLKDLRGKNLSCFCAELSPCHADVLLKWANAS